jgi:hypothetical protein
MMPQVTLEASTIERMKAYAEALVDTMDTVILKGLDAIDMVKAKTNEPTSAERIFNPASPPNLAYTTVKSVVWKGKRLSPAEAYWNPLMFIVIRECVKHMTKEQARNLILCNKVTGKKEDNGYKYVDEVGVSIQGQDANNAWKTTYNVLQALKMPVEVIFAWQDNPKATTPGAIGKFAVTFD